MFCIQDPSYENSMYLHETLLSECVGCTNGAGAYAFATKDGINLLLLDDNFKEFLKTGTFTLVVGTDDITNEQSIVSLIELQEKYGSHLVVKAYVHNGKGSTFHPKFSWFQKANSGALVLGSGNLTLKGLRHNREAYNVIQYDEAGIAEIVNEWNRWFVHSDPFLFDITDPVVLAKAKQNSEKIRAVSTAKATVQRDHAIKPGDIKLSDIYKTQPKDKRTRKKAAADQVSADPTPKTTSVAPAIIDEDLDVDFSYWMFDRQATALIAELPGRENSRMGQANFSKEMFQNYFGAREKEEGKSYKILLKNINDEGLLGETEVRPAVISTSHNYRFELQGAKDLVCGTDGRKVIAVFVKVANRDFMYTVLSSTHDEYDSILALLPDKQRANECRRVLFSAGEICDAAPNLKIWTRLEKEENE